MMIPLSVMLKPSKYNSLFIYTIAMAVVGGAALGAAFSNNVAAFDILTIVFFVGFIAFQFLANFFVIRSSNK
jgi:hypothetical protein